MLNYSAPPQLDGLFMALADGSRRSMVDRLSRGPASVKELAAPLKMSLPAVLQHLRVLEESGLVRSEKVGRVRTCRLEPAALQLAERWIADRRRSWSDRLDRLGDYLDTLDDELSGGPAGGLSDEPAGGLSGGPAGGLSRGELSGGLVARAAAENDGAAPESGSTSEKDSENDGKRKKGDK